MRTFAEIFCAQQHIAPEKFVRAVFWRCLYRRALPVAPIILMLDGEYFRPDFDFIASMGRSNQPEDQHEELVDFCIDSRNHNFWRGRLRLRVSGARLNRLMQRVVAIDREVSREAAPGRVHAGTH